MLLQFSISNFRSIGEEQIVSLVPAFKQKEYIENIIKEGRFLALNALAFYGPNGGGKSNLLRSMSHLKRMVELSARTSSTTPLPFDPFLLRKGWEERPTKTEIIFTNEDVRYRYGIEYNSEEILKEWLFRKNIGREVSLFERERDTIEVSTSFNGSKKLLDAAIEATRNNSLFLSTCDILNIEEAKSIIKWFRDFNVIDGTNTEIEEIKTIQLWNDQNYKEKIREYLSLLDLNIVDIDVTTKDFEESDLPIDIPKDLKEGIIKTMKGNRSYNIFAKHKIYDIDGNPTQNQQSWKWQERESSGAKKALQLSGPVLWALANGGVLIIDEIEAKMHPIMTLNTIDAFMDERSNPKKAQLVFSTHDTNLLTYSKLRRDQICFAEKNKWESTEIYSLADFIYFGEKNGKSFSEKERPDSDKEKRYFEGRYNAIPGLGDFQRFIRDKLWQNQE